MYPTQPQHGAGSTTVSSLSSYDEASLSTSGTTSAASSSLPGATSVSRWGTEPRRKGRITRSVYSEDSDELDVNSRGSVMSMSGGGVGGGNSRAYCEDDDTTTASPSQNSCSPTSSRA